jgi:hypothetical protein
MKVILSFTTALDALANGSLTEHDLSEALFCLGCTPGWPYERPVVILLQHGRYQKEDVKPADVHTFAAALKIAESEGRVVWRRSSESVDVDGHKVHQAISKFFTDRGLFPLNANLPPITENGFLKTAIEIADKTHGVEFVC